MKKFQKKLRNIINGFPKNLYWMILLLAISFTACKKEIPSSKTGEGALADNPSAAKSVLPKTTVLAGSSIQAAVDAATGPTIIEIEPGIYKEAILVNKPGIQLIGLKGVNNSVVIDNPGSEDNGITVRDGDGFVLKNVTVQNFKENGVFMIRSDDFILERVITNNNGEYGLYPIRCNNGIIKFCSATGHTDTGIYVGQSTNISVEFCVAFGNVAGYEIENCSNIIVSHNEAYDNAAGMLVFLLPGLRVKTSSDILVAHNKIHDNNHVNFAPPGGGFEVYIPSGSGILLVGADKTTIEYNQIVRNNFVGVATVSTLVLGALAGIPPGGFADIEPNPDGSKIVHNIVTDNGSAPPPGLPLPAADLLWDGSGVNNCWDKNKFSTSYPTGLPVCN